MKTLNLLLLAALCVLGTRERERERSGSQTSVFSRHMQRRTVVNLVAEVDENRNTIKWRDN